MSSQPGATQLVVNTDGIACFGRVRIAGIRLLAVQIKLLQWERNHGATQRPHDVVNSSYLFTASWSALKPRHALSAAPAE
jgi:hypothetical protein